jgi:hypothetical protein
LFTTTQVLAGSSIDWACLSKPATVAVGVDVGTGRGACVAVLEGAGLRDGWSAAEHAVTASSTIAAAATAATRRRGPVEFTARA